MYNRFRCRMRTPPFLRCPLVQDMTSSFCHMRQHQEMNCFLGWRAVDNVVFRVLAAGDTVDRIYYVNMSVLCMSWGVRCLRDSRKRFEYVGRGRKQTIPNIWKYFTNDSRFRDVCKLARFFPPLNVVWVFIGSSGHTILQWVFNTIEFSLKATVHPKRVSKCFHPHNIWNYMTFSVFLI